MSMNFTPQGERIHIGLFGRRNAGKSSLLNALTNQPAAIVSDQKGTTTDPVKKAMELLPLGPVLLIDTPGIDDDSALGAARMERTYIHLQNVNLAVLVVDGTAEDFSVEKELLREVKKQKKWYEIVINKSDLPVDRERIEREFAGERLSFISAHNAQQINELRQEVAERYAESEKHFLIKDLLKPGDIIVLFVPIDKAAPKGRLILPQQMVIREVLDAGAIAVALGENEWGGFADKMTCRPRMVVTDSQIFDKVKKIVPDDVSLTSFSILMSRYKGDIKSQAEAAKKIEKLREGAHILISEGCSHHRQCEDIGTVKLPSWIQKFTGKKFEFSFTGGSDFPADLSGYDLIVHCGGCTLHENEMRRRLKMAGENGVPMTNYGILIAYMNGILERCMEF